MKNYSLCLNTHKVFDIFWYLAIMLYVYKDKETERQTEI